MNASVNLDGKAPCAMLTLMIVKEVQQILATQPILVKMVASASIKSVITPVFVSQDILEKVVR